MYLYCTKFCSLVVKEYKNAFWFGLSFQIVVFSLQIGRVLQGHQLLRSCLDCLSHEGLRNCFQTYLFVWQIYSSPSKRYQQTPKNFSQFVHLSPSQPSAKQVSLDFQSGIQPVMQSNRQHRFHLATSSQSIDHIRYTISQEQVLQQFPLSGRQSLMPLPSTSSNLAPSSPQHLIQWPNSSFLLNLPSISSYDNDGSTESSLAASRRLSNSSLLLQEEFTPTDCPFSLQQILLSVIPSNHTRAFLTQLSFQNDWNQAVGQCLIFAELPEVQELVQPTHFQCSDFLLLYI